MKSLQLNGEADFQIQSDDIPESKLAGGNKRLNCEFSPSAPNLAWGSDITYPWIQSGLEPGGDHRSAILAAWSVGQLPAYEESAGHRDPGFE